MKHNKTSIETEGISGISLVLIIIAFQAVDILALILKYLE